MFRTIADFKAEWAYESEMTTRLFRNLSDQSLGQMIIEGGRSLGFLSWHVVVTLNEMLGKVGLVIDGPDEHAPLPASASAIADAYEKGAASVIEEVEKNWTDETLLLEDEMYGMIWKRGSTLAALINHQAHHRGQITVLMRQAGVPVIGVYGPAKEEWAEFGVPAPE